MSVVDNIHKQKDEKKVTGIAILLLFFTGDLLILFLNQ